MNAFSGLPRVPYGLCAAAVLLWGSAQAWAGTTTRTSRDVYQRITGGGGGAGHMPWQMVATVLVVLVLGALALVMVKKVLPRLGKSGGRRIAVLETAYLGPHKSVHLVQVGSTKVLVASSRDNVIRLGDVTEAFGPSYEEVARRVASQDCSSGPAASDRGAEEQAG